MKLRNVVIVSFVILLFLLAGCDRLPIIGAATGVVGPDMVEGSKDAGLNEPQERSPEKEETFFGGNRSGGSADGSGGDPDAGMDSGDEQVGDAAEPYCGDGVCDRSETCDKCKDCECEDNAICHDGKCKVPECMSDEDCMDDDGCTVDKCMFAPHPNAYCSDEVITTRNHYDGCCPDGAYVDVDADCVPVCGDGRCDYGENEGSCLEDCEHYGESGGSSSSAPSSPTAETSPT